jgi:Na+-translocating ferredoxin:NAD+ oxidoreductase RnfD subunit
MSALLQFADKLSSKTYLLILLFMLAILGAFQQGIQNVYQQLLLAVATAVVLDVIISYIKSKRLIIPSSALITGMIIAMVLGIGAAWYIPVVASAIAIIQKHLLRYPANKPIFNPAALGLLAVIFLLNANVNWWGQSNWWLIIAFGAFISFQAKKIKIPIVFIISFAIISTIGFYFINNMWINPFLYINFFFVFIMLIEPKTSPYLQSEQCIYAIVAAIFSNLFFLLMPQYDYSILAIIAANLLMCIRAAITK